jgi:DNA primase
MTNGWVDFRLVKESVSMQMVLEHYGVNGLRKNGNELRGQCPIHKGEGASFHVNVSKNVFQCFSCKARGNVIDFVAALEGCTIRDAALKLNVWFGVEESKQRSTPTQEAPAQTVEAHTQEAALAGPINPPLPFQLRVDPGHEYGIGRGVSREMLEYFGAGFCLSKGTFAGRFVFPLHNEAGELVGYAGRTTDDSEPKYLFPAGAKGFHKSHLVYNLHRILSEMPETDLVIVVEGFFGCLRLTQAGYPSVALLGSSLSAEQEELLCHHFRRAFLLFDGDEAGRGATDTCLQRLGRRLWVKAISLPDHVQPDHLDEEAIKQLLGPAL